MQNIAWHNADDGEPSFVIENVEKYPGVFGGVVINATWRALQPHQGGPLDPSTVDEALAKVRAYNAAHPSAPLGVKLRVYGGSTAPTWAKQLAGGPIHIQRNPKGCAHPPCELTVGKHWSEAYVAAWRHFQGCSPPATTPIRSSATSRSRRAPSRPMSPSSPPRTRPRVKRSRPPGTTTPCSSVA